MANKITFQFDDSLDYQLQAVQSTVELFRGISRKVDGIYRPNRTRKIGEGDPVRNTDIVVGSRLLENLRGVQLSNDLFADTALAEGNNFTIEMETGTGKTYVYLRTILELNKEYGFNKFMIVVPSIAIRKGGTIRFETFNVAGGASLEELSGGLPQYKNYRVAEQPHKLKSLQIATPDGIFSLDMEHSNHEIEKNEAVRIQIRLAIQNHFAKQLDLLRKGRKIKALTLFFI
ncbi:MAG: DEAD/DEAH box helicase family protein [Lachnospiraceae bacterium]|nr:DEAD/DEAH box helicase family protein [Lachnospiraceae bacterium]